MIQKNTVREMKTSILSVSLLVGSIAGLVADPSPCIGTGLKPCGGGWIENTSVQDGGCWASPGNVISAIPAQTGKLSFTTTTLNCHWSCQSWGLDENNHAALLTLTANADVPASYASGAACPAGTGTGTGG